MQTVKLIIEFEGTDFRVAPTQLEDGSGYSCGNPSHHLWKDSASQIIESHRCGRSCSKNASGVRVGENPANEGISQRIERLLP